MREFHESASERFRVCVCVCVCVCVREREWSVERECVCVVYLFIMSELVYFFSGLSHRNTLHINTTAQKALKSSITEYYSLVKRRAFVVSLSLTAHIFHSPEPTVHKYSGTSE